MSGSKAANPASPTTALADTDAPVAQERPNVAASAKYDIIRHRTGDEPTGYNAEVSLGLSDNPGTHNLR